MCFDGLQHGDATCGSWCEMVAASQNKWKLPKNEWKQRLSLSGHCVCHPEQRVAKGIDDFEWKGVANITSHTLII